MATWVSNGADTGGSGSYVSGTQGVQYIHDNFASAGDTIQIPNGSFTWTTGITLTKGITLTGATAGKAFVTNDIGSVALGSPATGNCIAASCGTDNHIIIQNINFYIMASDTSGNYTIYAQRTVGSSSNPYTVIIKGCVFNSAQVYTYAINTFSNGIIISKCQFYGDGSNGLGGIKLVCNGYSSTQQVWNYPDTLGGGTTTYGTGDINTAVAPAGLNNTYIEDCIFYDSGNPDADDNARVVYRHNTVINSTMFYSHGQDTSPYGPRHWEIYNNNGYGSNYNATFTGTFVQPAVGASVTWNVSTMTTAQQAQLSFVPNQVACIKGPGGNYYDLYTITVLNATQISAVNLGWPQGTAAGTTMAGNGATIFGPSATGFGGLGTNYPINWGAGWIFHRGGTGVITGNNCPTIQSIQGYPGAAQIGLTVQQINRGDAQPCQTAYPACRQVGVGWSSGSSTPFGTPAIRGAVSGYPFLADDGVGQVVNPVYIWNNSGGFTNTSSDVGLVQYTPDDCGNGELIGTFLQINRDFYVGTAMPEWVAYTYPHPLVAPSGQVTIQGNVGVTGAVNVTLSAVKPVISGSWGVTGQVLITNSAAVVQTRVSISFVFP